MAKVPTPKGWAHQFTFSHSIGGDTPTWEGEITVAYNIQPGEPETGPTYACGGTPASDPMVIDVILLAVDGSPRPWIHYAGADQDLEERFVEAAEDHHDQMLEDAFEKELA